MRFRVLFIIGTLAVLLVVGVAQANHSWGGYHWARTANPFTLKLGDNVGAVWDGHLTTASGDWSVSSALDTTIIAGQSKGNCRPTNGRVEVCNRTYGFNGWLGLAQIWVTSDQHITNGVVKLNDTYFNTPTYNTPAWRNLVVCQEIGHTIGLDHQDENFSNPPLGTCMDYSSDPTPNQHPNQHDYDQLEAIYAHLDSVTTLSQSNVSNRRDANHEDSGEWGKSRKRDARGRTSIYEQDLGKGEKVFTFVFWTE